MKNKLLVALLAVVFAATSAHAGLIGPGKISVGADLSVPYWVGLGVEYSIPVTPLVDLGVEYSNGSIEKNDFETGTVGVTAKAKIEGSRVGLTAKLNLPILPLKFHVGSHSGKLTAGTNVVIPGASSALPGGDIAGTYFNIGLDYQIGPVFIEPRVGFQTLTVAGTKVDLNKYPLSDLGLRAGIRF